MNDEAAVEPQEPMDTIMEQHGAEHEEPEVNENEVREKTMIPLSVAQKLRQQKRELELELQWERQRNAQVAASKPPEEDNSRYESATREDLIRSREETVRDVEERLWIKNNPEKKQRIDEYLPQFLKQRPNLASAINQASNRYEEAYELMDKLTPKQQQQLAKASTPKKEAPNAPNGVPKAAALNESIDIMGMNDSEFAAWRASRRKRR